MKSSEKQIEISGEIISPSDQELSEEVSAELDAILEADFRKPVRPKTPLKDINKRDKAYKYYMYVQPDIPDWWEEFQTALDEKTGLPKYKTIRQFAESRTKTPQEQRWILEMIGPKPDPNVTRRVPWLGDWKDMRATGYITPRMPAKLKELAKSFKDRIVAVDAIRSAAPYLVQELMRYTKLAEQIDTAFAGQAFDSEVSPNDPGNMARFRAYLSLQKSVTNMKFRCLHQWFLIHGVNPDDKNQMQVYQQLVQHNQIVAPTANEPLHNVNEEISARELEAWKLSKHLLAHEEAFNMPLPESIKPKAIEGEVVAKKNGKGVQ